MCSDKHSSLTNIVFSLSIKIFCIYSMMDGYVIVIYCGSQAMIGSIILLLSNFDCPVPKILQAPNCTVHDWHLKHIRNTQIHQKLCLRSLYGSYLAHTFIEHVGICTTDTIFSSCMYLFKDTFKSFTLHCLSHTCQDASNL